MSAQDVEKAVEVALDPSVDVGIKQQATDFIATVRASPEGWKVCQEIFVNKTAFREASRLVSLQILCEKASDWKKEVNGMELEMVKENVWAYVKEQKYLDDPAYIINAIQHLLTLLFIQLYPVRWNDFFQSLQSMAASSSQVEPSNFYLKMLLSIGEEVADSFIPKSTTRAQQSTAVKDAIRENDMSQIVSFVFEMMVAYSNAKSYSPVVLSLQVFGQWVSWINISLIVNEPCMNLLYSFLQVPELRCAACETITEIVNKKMKPLDKYSLLVLLNLNYFFTQFQEQSSDPTFDEHIAKLVNAQGVELLAIKSDPTEMTSETLENCSYQLYTLFPYLIRYLSDDYDETSSAVFPFLSDLLTSLRKESSSKPLTDSSKQLLTSLLQALAKKMTYDESQEWDDDPESEEEAEFQELRKKLKTFQDTINLIDHALYANFMYSVITSSISSAAAMPIENSWQLVEFALHETYIFGEGMRGPTAYVNEADKSPTPLSQILLLVIESQVGRHPHPLVQLLYMEILVRYSGFFEYQPSAIGPIMEYFVGPTGIHNSNERVRVRAWYLFYRFVRSVTKYVATYAESSLALLGDLLNIDVQPSTDIDSPEPTLNSSIRNSSFNSQLYLFETAGILISSGALPREEQVLFCDSLIDALLYKANSALSSNASSLESIISVYCSLMAIGNFAKGFPARDSQEIAWLSTFNKASDAIFSILNTMGFSEDIRSAVRFASGRIINVVGPDMLPKVPQLVSLLLSSISINELVDVLSFISQLIYIYKEAMMGVISNLLPSLLSTVFTSLSETPQGTDDAIKQSDLRKSYISFILHLLNKGFGSAFFAEQVQSYFDPLINSIIHFANLYGEPSTQKSSIALLSKMVSLWGGPDGIEGFERVIFGSLSPLCFEMPVNPVFNANDGQSHIVLGELANLQRTILEMCGESYRSYLLGVYFPTVNFPEMLASEYLQVLVNSDSRTFKQFFQKFIQAIKKGQA
ncbi:karyopherin/importin-beta family nuclear import receptor Los1 [Schizosaccharomyces osmophilus]|uniref:Exportin-T n=1 Tax=Schizosaccharomyces osmophilus TaxID=2545709 RepID=A0AAE9W6W9_9SCHI|nr:karyopherin/importin-beta family nuclear import receptor Los1 [Schizosaccharomyces osmophilus]WBW71081.1 karyopherin/importin-beta family nuclear import receptor Los1 [Schizosaccharomyces osmophilus]